MLLLKKNGFAIESGSRLVRAADLATVRSAGEILAAAEAEAVAIRASAKDAYEEERKRGYADGRRQSDMEAIERKMDLVNASVSFMESVEDKMADVVKKALRKCLAEIGDEELVVQIVKKLMKAVIRTQKHVTLRVSPDMAETVKARLSELVAPYPSVVEADVAEDPRLSGTSCLLETEAGVADASIDTQLAAIERSIERHIKSK